jgi:hemerythrin-like domain-containing protein
MTAALQTGIAALLLAAGCGGAGPTPEHPAHATPAHTHAHPTPAGGRPSEPFRAEHVHISERLDQTETLAANLGSSPSEDVPRQITAILDFFLQELRPHAAAEEAVLYAVADRYVPAPAPHRWTDSLRYEHTVVHAAIEEMERFAAGDDRSPEALSRFSRLVIRTIGLVKGHFGAEENVVHDALDRVMSAEQFTEQVVRPTEAHVHGAHH